MSFDVFAVGNALVDIQARVADDVPARLGFSKAVMTLVDDAKQADVLNALDEASVTRCPGGSAANTVMGIADFGGTAAYAAKVGDDGNGAFYADDLRQAGVEYRINPADGPTGTSVILITPDGERTMLTNLAASVTLGAGDISEDLVRQAKYVYVEGYLFTGESTKAAAYRTIELAKHHGVKVAFTVSDPFLINGFKDEFWELIRGPVDLLFCNLEEARSLTGEEDAVQCAAAIHEHAENVALTLGGDGSILMHEGRTIPIEGVAAKAIDTTGAGDMYAAGVLYGVTNGMDWGAAGRLASHAAARVVSQLGARLATPFTPEQVRTLAAADSVGGASA